MCDFVLQVIDLYCCSFDVLHEPVGEWVMQGEFFFQFWWIFLRNLVSI